MAAAKRTDKVNVLPRLAFHKLVTSTAYHPTSLPGVVVLPSLPAIVNVPCVAQLVSVASRVGWVVATLYPALGSENVRPTDSQNRGGPSDILAGAGSGEALVVVIVKVECRIRNC